MMNSIKTSLPIALHARNSPRWVHSVIENVRRKGVGSVGLYPFIQALESVTEKRTAIPCENLVTDQIRKDCWIEKLSKFLGESVRSRNCSSFFCYGFSAKDTGYRPAYSTPLRRALLNHKIYSSKFPFTPLSSSESLLHRRIVLNIFFHSPVHVLNLDSVRTNKLTSALLLHFL